MVRWVRCVVAVLALLGLPAIVSAQNSGISGVVRDSSGAVLPGVTVEAASPALIERVRTTVSDESGQYRIVDLRPGTYTVTFALEGFNTVHRPGIELTTGFTANVSADLRVGDLSETITVSGASPVVDIQNVIQQRVMTRDQIDSLPTAKVYNALATLLPGTIASNVSGGGGAIGDIGGVYGDRQVQVAIHGSKTTDQKLHMNGMSFVGAENSQTPLQPNDAMIQEMQVEVGAQSTETESGGVRLNIIPKEGGNRYSGMLFGSFANGSLQGDNYDQHLKDLKLTAIDKVKSIYDVNPAVGGPLKQDQLWFFAAYRYWGNERYVGGNFYNKTPESFLYTPDLSRQALDDYVNDDVNGRLTWQADQKNKVSIFAERQDRTGRHWPITANFAPEAVAHQPLQSPGTYQGTWTRTFTNRLLLDVGMTQYTGDWSTEPSEPGVTNQTIPVTELSTGYAYRGLMVLGGAGYGARRNLSEQRNYRAAMTYATGSHAAKLGMQFYRLHQETDIYGPDVRYNFFNQRPAQVIEVATPYTFFADVSGALGVFAQDQWTRNRLTLNLGLRFDYHNSSVPPQTLGPGDLVPNRNYSDNGFKDVPNWKDLSPRLGAAYDLFGNGKTAVKASLSKYLVTQTTAIANSRNPLNAPSQVATRTWIDANNDFIPQGDLTNTLANGELLALSNQNFGKAAGATNYSDDVTKGFGVRTYNWEVSTSVQQELRPGASFTAAYFRRWYGNIIGTQNRALTAADFDTYCINAPVDARLPNSGQPICGLVDINPSKFLTPPDNIVVRANGAKEVYNGVDLTISTRLRTGVLLQGGLNTGRSTINNCDPLANITSVGGLGNATSAAAVNQVGSQRFCDITPKLLTQVKLQGSYPLPFDTQFSAAFQSIPGPEVSAAQSVPAATIAQGLGRNTASGGPATIQLITPGTLYGDRTYQLDLRFSKRVSVGRSRLEGMVDVYNALNGNPVLGFNTTYGPNWLVPQIVLPARFLKLSARLSF